MGAKGTAATQNYGGDSYNGSNLSCSSSFCTHAMGSGTSLSSSQTCVTPTYLDDVIYSFESVSDFQMRVIVKADSMGKIPDIASMKYSVDASQSNEQDAKCVVSS